MEQPTSKWPNLALAVNENSTVRCTSTIGKSLTSMMSHAMLIPSSIAVAPKWALASYSCIIGKTEFVSRRKDDISWWLYTGISHFDSSSDLPNTQRVEVARIYAYPQVSFPLNNQLVSTELIERFSQAKFKQFQYSGDAVLLELTQPLKFDASVSSACLSETTINQSQKCMTTGWGVISSGGESSLFPHRPSPGFTYIFPTESQQRQYLSHLTLPTIDMDKCNSSNHYAGALSEDAICSEHTSTPTTCYVSNQRLHQKTSAATYLLQISFQNDEGAPLMCFSNRTSTWELQGLLSYHGNCGRRPQPTVYSAMTPQLLNWIVRTIGNDQMVRRAP